MSCTFGSQSNAAFLRAVMEIDTSETAPFLSRLVKGYVSALSRFRVLVALFWVGVFAVSCAFGPKLSAASSNKFTSPPNTPSATADALMTQWFPQVGNSAAIVLVIQSLRTQVLTR